MWGIEAIREVAGRSEGPERLKGQLRLLLLETMRRDFWRKAERCGLAKRGGVRGSAGRDGLSELPLSPTVEEALLS